MNNDELATRRAQAIAEDRCFSKGRLRDESRMKPIDMRNGLILRQRLSLLNYRHCGIAFRLSD